MLLTASPIEPPVGGAAMSELLADLALVAAAVWKEVGTVATTITGTPILLLTVGILLAGAAVGIFGRLLSRG